jgi:hypothetical protein
LREIHRLRDNAMSKLAAFAYQKYHSVSTPCSNGMHSWSKVVDLVG